MSHGHDVAVIDALADELARLRGASSGGAPPLLDTDENSGAFLTGVGPDRNEEDATIAESLSRMQERVAQAAVMTQQNERAALQQQLTQTDLHKQSQRQALLSYLDELKAREDEAGDAIRQPEFSHEVDSLVQEQRRATEEHARAEAATSEPHVHDILQHVQDPATFEALLEVQRLDEALGSVPKNAQQAEQQQQQQLELQLQQHAAAAAAGGAGAASSGRRAKPPSRSSSARRPGAPAQPPPPIQPLLTLPSAGVAPAGVPNAGVPAGRPRGPPSAGSARGSVSSARGGSDSGRSPSRHPPSPSAGAAGTFLTGTDEVVPAATGDVVAALTEEVARLKGISVSGGDRDEVGSVSGTSTASRRSASSSRFVNGAGKHKSLGGVWMSAADEARVERLLEALEAEMDDESLRGYYEHGIIPDGEGYNPPAEEAARLREIETALDELLVVPPGGDDAAESILRPHMPALDSPSERSAKAATAPPNPYDDYLVDMKRERQFAEAETRVANRLNALHTISSNAPASDGDEQRMLAELLGHVRDQAERVVDEHDATRPRTAGSSGGGDVMID